MSSTESLEVRTSAPSFQRILAKAVGSPLFWLAWVGAAFTVHITRAVTNELPPEPETYHRVPAFSLTDQHGRTFGSRDLEGRIWVANFIFTHCPTRCENLTQRMGEVQKRMGYAGDSVHLVSFSVDPENDTPSALAAYADKHKAGPRWHFLTGELGAVKKAVVDGFKLPMEPNEEADTDGELMSITHGTRFVLVDAKGYIRGYYEADDEGFRDLLTHISLVSGLEARPGVTRRFEEEQREKRDLDLSRDLSP